MHRIPRVFGHSSNRTRTGADSGAASTSSSSSPAAKPKPRLERRNAKKNINYDYSPSASSSSSHFSNDESMRTRSLDLYDGRTSFRVEGVDGEIEIICRNLGFTIDDFSINAEEYEAMKVRSISAPVVFSQSIEPLVDREMKANPIISRNCEVIISKDNASVVSSNGLVRGNGIKGARPPLMTLPKIENKCSAWDMPSLEQGLCSDEDDENLKRRDENCVLSASCSFTASSNDDDSSSTTTEPMMSASPNGRFKRIISEWQKGELLGRGSFGSVYEGIADCGFFFAVKEVSLLDQDDEGKQCILQLEQEIALLSQFEHENIVQYYGTKKDESKLYIFLELVTKGSLLSLYQKYTLRDSQVWSYTRQILHGLKYLHDRNVVHRDIKCANILVDTNGSVKLADFGLAKATKLNDVKSCKGTPFWMAPEVVRSLGYGLPADIWSLGCTVLEMLTGRFPYSNLECLAALFRIGRGERPVIPESLSNDARDFILKCLQVDPSLRPTAAELLDHPFVVPPLAAAIHILRRLCFSSLFKQASPDVKQTMFGETETIRDGLLVCAIQSSCWN